MSTRKAAHVMMLRQFDRRRALVAALTLAMLAGAAGCGIKGPLRPAPKAAATTTPPPIENPATPPATTSPALPPPSTPERKP
jgi:predicted small lipoprotein YifL